MSVGGWLNLYLDVPDIVNRRMNVCVDCITPEEKGNQPSCEKTRTCSKENTKGFEPFRTEKKVG